jgi:hypothetical protein
MELDRGLMFARWGAQLFPRVLHATMRAPDLCAECGGEFVSGDRSVWIFTDRVHEACNPFLSPEESQAA